MAAAAIGLRRLSSQRIVSSRRCEHPADVVRWLGTDEDLVRAIASAVVGKRPGHVFERDGHGAPKKHMIGIGG